MEDQRQIYLLFKDESHGEHDSLEQQQHAENAQELQREIKKAAGAEGLT